MSSDRTRTPDPGDTMPDAPELTGLGRWRVLDRVGAGGMGVVYRALDLEQNRVVALKTLRRTDTAGLLRLKAEFRAAADVAHENLALLHELVAEDDRWFFAMEYVEGVHFLEHVRGGEPEPDHSPSELARARAADTLIELPGGGSVAPPPPPEPNVVALDEAGVARLRPALLQLVRGVSALHAAGKLHRDLKPSNVMVAKDGRVVVLDFGLAVGDATGSALLYGPTAGTPAFMAPEQALGQGLGPASDWYAVGVMLFQALTGHLPFRGSAREVLEIKVEREALAPSILAPSIPDDLDRLCVDLLAMNPDDRPTGDEIRERLEARISEAPRGRPARRFVTHTTDFGRTPIAHAFDELSADASSRVASMSGERIVIHRTPRGESTTGPSGRAGGPGSALPTLVGRDAELEVLDAAFAEACAGESVAVLVDGPSGVGKSALVRSFAERARRSVGALVLEGRCYERETVPYKAFDALVDALEQHLGNLHPSDLSTLLPPGVNELARIFPVLREVAARATADGRDHEGPDPQELQARAFRCLKLLLARLAAERPLVLVIDDLQWGDRDSGRLLGEILAPPDQPALLLLCTYRSEVGGSPMASEEARRELFADAHTIRVGPLPQDQATELARAMIARAGGDSAISAAEIAREAAGSPFFVEELVRWAEIGGGASVSLGDLVVARAKQLAPEARAVLEVVCVASHPIEQGVAAAAAGAIDARPSIAALRTGMLVRTRGPRDVDAVEPYHDRIRESIARHLDAEARSRIHVALGRALEATGRADARDLAHHYHAGGAFDDAWVHAVRAADAALQGLAFDRAADLYALAISCEKGSRYERSEIELKWADALVHAGRCAEAAPVYLAAASKRGGAEAWDLRRRATEQLLVSGRIDEGASALIPVLEDVDLSYPSTPRRALVAVIARVVQLEARGRKFRPRDERDVLERDLRRFEACWSAGKGLLSVDNIRGAYFFVRALLVALDAGEPHRLVRALAIYGMMQVFEGDPRGHARGSRILDEADQLARPLNDAYLDNLVRICRGTAKMSVGKFREGLEMMESGLEGLEANSSGITWEIGSCRSSCFNARLWLGEIREITQAAPSFQRLSARVGSVFAEVTAELYTAFGQIAAGHPQAARERVHGAMAKWTRYGFHFQHWLAVKVEAWCDLYEGNADAAWARLELAWPALEDSGLLRVQLMKVDALLLRGLAAVATSDARPKRLAIAARDVVSLRKLGREASSAASELLGGQVALAERKEAEARRSLRRAIDGFRVADARLHAECARRRLGELTGGAEGEAMIVKSEEWMRAQGIVDPEKFARAFAPRTGRQGARR
jgi:serine/threonine protein kinase